MAKVAVGFAKALAALKAHRRKGSPADMRRAFAYWREDLERFEETCHGASGEVKVQVAGPITLAAAVALPLASNVI